MLAVVLIVFDTERHSDIQGCEPQYLEHDVYTFFDALLTKLGVSKLYQETKDISDLAAEMSKSVPDPKLFGSDPKEAQKRRKQAEQAFEREKSKVKISLCNLFRLRLCGDVVTYMTSI